MKVLILILAFSICSASNILLMFPLSVKSHVNSFTPIFEKLSQNGHNLTMVISFEPTIIIPNCTYVHVRNRMFEIVANSSRENMMDYVQNANVLAHMPLIWSLQLKAVEKFLKEGSLETLVRGDNDFDLMISETLYLQELFVAFGYIFNVPVINIDAHTPNAWSCYLTGNVNPYAYVPDFKLTATDHMSFFERAQNTLINLQIVLGSYYYFLPNQEKLMRKYLSFGKFNFPPLLDMLKNTSLTLVDSHFSYGYVRPYTPNVIEVGGMTFNSGRHLNEEFQKLMDESTDGVIFFTLGSIMDPSYFPDRIIEVFMSAFGKLNQTVIMRWSSKHILKKPKNVKTSSWLPQNGILGHPNCRLFISHGGIHGMTEAIYHKVPLLMIPFFSDQHFNAKFAETGGFAYVLKNTNLTFDNLLYAINAVMNNPNYKKNIERRSLILRDKPLSSVDTAVYWVEYVLRHKGAKHLRPASLDLNFFQYFLLDVILITLIGIVASVGSIYYILYTIFKCIKTVVTKSKEKFE